MKNSRKVHHFLDIDFDITQGLLQLSQEKYATKVLERFNLSDCKPRMMPCEQKLDFINSNSNGLVNPKRYCEVIASLIYLMTCTRLDLSYIVGKLSQYLSEPYEHH